MLLLHGLLLCGFGSAIRGKDESASLNFGSVFDSSGAIPILQQEKWVTIWGNCTSPGATVTLRLAGVTVATTVVAQDGKWTTQIPPQPTQWNVQLHATVLGGASTITTVHFGMVILCSGQSNMQMCLSARSPGAFGSLDGAAEAARAGNYTGKIALMSIQTPFPKPVAPPWNGTTCLGFPALKDPLCRPEPMWNAVSPGPNGTVRGFSAVCWYTGRLMFEALGGRVPIGLIVGSVGGSPIEVWLPPGDVNTSEACGIDDPPCDINNNLTDSIFYNRFIEPFAPYTLGAVVWDQGERDVHCFAPATNHTARYPCLERRLIDSWRRVFNSSFAFVTVQLPGYIGDCDAVGANPAATYTNCVPGVYNMRVAQDAGTTGDDAAAVAVTYDLSCSFGVSPPDCPFGSVHNLNKVPVADRIVKQLLRLTDQVGGVSEGPRAVSASARQSAAGNWLVTVTLRGGSTPLCMNGTQNCDVCCSDPTGPSDFDVSTDGGVTFRNATLPTTIGSAIQISVQLEEKPTHVRYTANQGFPQCAVYNSEGFPLFPFYLTVHTETDKRAVGEETRV